MAKDKRITRIENIIKKIIIEKIEQNGHKKKRKKNNFK